VLRKTENKGKSKLQALKGTLKSMRLYFWLVLGLVLSGSLIFTVFSQTSDLSRIAPFGTSTPLTGSVTRDPVIAGMIGEMNKSNIYSTTYDLQRIPTRLYGTAGNVQAATYLYNKLSGIPGLKGRVAYDHVNSFKNVIAILPGTDTSSKEIVMVGAHYDSTSSDPAKAPGATDNACGVAIVLELARVMSQHQFNHTIAFALWNDEEQGNQGSNAYVVSAVQSAQKIPLYFNYDSSCYDPNNRFVLDIKYNSQSSWAKDMMTQDNTLYGIGFTLTYNVHASCSSDHAAFWAVGYSAVMTHEETHGPAHTPSDTIDKVSTTYALKNGQLGLAVLAQTAGVRGTVKDPTTATLTAPAVSGPLSISTSS
jgi:Peptidase family M28